MSNEPAQSNPAGNAWQKKAALFLASQSLSVFGSTVVGFVIIWHVALETSSGRWMTAVILCAMLPQLFVSLAAGVLADRYDRKKIAMLSDAFIALVTGALAVLFLTGRGSLEILLAGSALRSAGAGLQSPATSALLPQIVPREHLTRINGLYHTANSVFMLLSPACGALMLGLFGMSWAFMLDVLTAAGAIGILSRIEIPRIAPARPEGAKQSMLGDIRSGLAYALGHRLIRRIVICYLVFFFLHTPVSFLTPVMIGRSFGPEVWRLSANEMVWTVGSLIGGLYVSIKGEFRDKMAAIGYCIVAFGILFSLLGSASGFMLYLAIMGVAGFFLPVVTTAQTVLIQENAPPDVMGRVFSVVQLIPSAMMPLGMLFYGPLGDAVQIEKILIVSGGLMVLLGFAFSLTRERPKKGAGA